MAASFTFDDAVQFTSRIPLSLRMPAGSGSAFTSLARAAQGLGRLPSLLGRITSDGQFYDDPEDGPDVKVLLDSKFIAEKAEGMKRLLALMSLGTDVSEFFPEVVKNIVVQSLHVKRMVYMYLAHYAQRRPDEALLAINSLQRELSDPNPLVRAQALRAMSRIRLQAVTPLLAMAVRKCARDPSAYVRRCAAHAISQIHAIDRDQHQEVLEELVEVLLGDSSTTVLGPAAAAFLTICPQRLDILRTKFLNLCQNLRDMDEWTQVIVLDLLLRYVLGRHGCPEGSMGADQTAKAIGKEGSGMGFSLNQELKAEAVGQATNKELEGESGEVERGDGSAVGAHEQARKSGNSYEDFFASGTQAEGSNQSLGEARRGGTWGEKGGIGEFGDVHRQRGSWVNGQTRVGATKVHNDVKLLLKCVGPLLHSRNSAVVMAAAGVKWQLANKDELKQVAKPLVCLLRSSPDSQYVVLASISTMANALPSMFDALHEDFFIRATDAPVIRSLKLGILADIATEGSMRSILRELQTYVHDPDRQFAAETVRTIASCSVRLPGIAAICMEGLLQLAQSQSGEQNSTRSSRYRSKTSLVRGSFEAAPSNSNSEGGGKGLEVKRTVETEDSKVMVREERAADSEGVWFLGGQSERGVAEERRQGGEERDGVVVKEAVAAIRSLVQLQPSRHEEALARLLRNFNSLEVSEARAVAVWLAGEYCSQGEVLSQMAPLVMRHMALHFKEEDDVTKLQTMNSTAKVLLRSKAPIGSPEKNSLHLLMQYILDMAHYDQNYDIRDRGRMLRNLLKLHSNAESGQTSFKNGAENSEEAGGLTGETGGERDWAAELITDLSGKEKSGRERESAVLGEPDRKADDLASGERVGRNEQEEKVREQFLAKSVEKILLSHKPLPGLLPFLPDRSSFTIGSLSHTVNHRAPGYEPLPEPNSIEETPTEVVSERIEVINRERDTWRKSEEDNKYDAEDWTSESASFYSSDYTDSDREGENDSLSLHSDFGKKASGVGGLEGDQRVAADGGALSPLSREVGMDRESSRRGIQKENRRFDEADFRPLIDLSEGGGEAMAPSGVTGVQYSLMDWDGREGDSVREAGGEMLASSSLEGWLTAEPSNRAIPSINSANVTGNWATYLEGLKGCPRRQRLLDFTKGDGLEVDYTFDRDIGGKKAEHLIGVRLHLQNRSTETLLNISVLESEEVAASSGDAKESISSIAAAKRPSIIPSEEIQELGVGQAAEAHLYVDCSYQLKPVKLAVACNGKTIPAKLSLDVGTLLQPKAIGDETFGQLEGQLTGMHEAKKRSILAGRVPKTGTSQSNPRDVPNDLQYVRTAAKKILDVVCTALVSATADDMADHSWQKWRLRFSAQTLTRGLPCLMTVSNEGAPMQEGTEVWRAVVQVKVNCEDAVLGLNLLKAAEEALKSL